MWARATRPRAAPCPLRAAALPADLGRRALGGDGCRVGILAGDRLLEATHAGTERAAELRQALGAEHQQQQDEQEGDVQRVVESQHGCTPIRLWLSPVRTGGEVGS